MACVLGDKQPSVEWHGRRLKATEAVVAINQSIVSGQVVELRQPAGAR